MEEVEQLRQRVQELEKELAEVRQTFQQELMELKPPLKPMKGFILTLLDDEKEEWYTLDDRHEFYKIIKESTDRLEQHLNELLKGSSLAKSKRLVMDWQENVDVCKLIEDVVEAEQKLTSKHTLIADIPAEPLLIETDPDSFKKILLSIVRNAIKYSPNGGEIRITARIHPPDEKCPSPTVHIQIKDQGVGISKELQKSRDFRGWRRPVLKKYSMQDAGIGLIWVCNHIAAHHGMYRIDSDGVDKGTIFSFRIPLKQPSNEDAPR